MKELCDELTILRIITGNAVGDIGVCDKSKCDELIWMANHIQLYYINGDSAFLLNEGSYIFSAIISFIIIE